MHTVFQKRINGVVVDVRIEIAACPEHDSGTSAKPHVYYDKNSMMMPMVCIPGVVKIPVEK